MFLTASRCALSRFQIRRKVTKSDVEQFARLTGDTNPIHFEGPRPIAHGVLLQGFVSGVIGTECPGPGTLVLSQQIKFSNPCPVDSEVEITVEMLNEKKISECKFEVVLCENDLMLLSGTAKLLAPKN